MAPQHPKKAITKIIQPITITPIADVEVLPCISDESPFRFICTKTPQTRRAKPHSCKKRKKYIIFVYNYCVHVHI